MNAEHPSRSVKFRPFSPGDEQAIAQLFEVAFGKPMAVEFYRWRFVNNPAGKGICELAFDGDRLCAHCGVTRVTILCDGKEMQAGLGGTAMTHPDYQGRGLYALLYNRAFEWMLQEEIFLFFAFPDAHRSAHRLLKRKLGFVDIYEVPRFSLRFKDRRPVTEDNRSDLYIKELKDFDERFDRLWETVSNEYRVIVKRNSRYLNWRFIKNPGAQYRILGYCNKEELLGYAVLKDYGKDLQVVDLLTVPETNIGLALINHTIQLAMRQDLESVSMWLNPANRLHIELERLGFKPNEPVVYFGGRVLNTPSLESPFYSYRNWHLMMSDSDVF